MDQKWMFANRLSNEYEGGVNEFVSFAVQHAEAIDNIICPCLRCYHIRRVNQSELKDHLIINGIDPRFVYDIVMLEHGLRERFSFLSPAQTTKFSYEQVNYIHEAFTAQVRRDKLFLAPFNAGEHWVLIVIDVFKERIYYLDHLRQELTERKQMKLMFDTALKVHRSTSGMSVPKAKQNYIPWDIIECPRQTNSVDCGYYVMKFMKDIITHQQLVIPTKYFEDCQFISYNEEQLREVKDEWAAYVFYNCF
ncbi:uncharacterized protein LOC130719074 [Lotus japonicus]|uniref:uncharacterized protein LOC130719074 n=1 Tax=Lotus japonicus TaxID=34305 RepID=UPI002585935A|nr:uncharacterized protein LOC130719074 [Lotus japonicus]